MSRARHGHHTKIGRKPTTTIELASCTKIVYEAIEPGSLPSHRDQAAMGECEIPSTLRLYFGSRRVFLGFVLGLCVGPWYDNHFVRAHAFSMLLAMTLDTDHMK
jgi:hypothetical protein